MKKDIYYVIHFSASNNAIAAMMENEGIKRDEHVKYKTQWGLENSKNGGKMHWHWTSGIEIYTPGYQSLFTWPHFAFKHV